MAWKTLDQMDLNGKRVLTRVDINVPMKDGVVTDATRIERIKPTIDSIFAAGGTPVLLAHFDRPKGKVVPEMSLSHVAPKVEEVLGRKVTFVDALDADAVAAAESGSIVLIENTRFHPGEEKNDPALAKEFAALGDIFCNDAFSAAHRAHASTEGLAHLLPACAGRNMEAELTALESALGQPERPVVAVVGGAKVSTKLDLLSNLIEKVDYLVIGGGMANTFLAALGLGVGKSLCEHDLASTAMDIINKAQRENCEIILPVDVVVAAEFAAGAPSITVAVDAVPADRMILDVGMKTVALIGQRIAGAKTLVWNGPLGAFEIEPFDRATVLAAQAAARATNIDKLVSVAGGGDTVAALNHAGVAKDFSYVSTAGGAFLEWMEGKELPGVTALQA